MPKPVNKRTEYIYDKEAWVQRAQALRQQPNVKNLQELYDGCFDAWLLMWDEEIEDDPAG